MTSTNTAGITVRFSFLTTFSLACALICACASTPKATREPNEVVTPVEGTVAAERLTIPAPGTIILEALEGPVDTLAFHIGSPVFLRMSIGEPAGCAPGTGEMFYFDATGTQLGWSFEEVRDSLLFPPVASRCERVIMLSSEASNRLAEGRFTMRSELFIEPRKRTPSNLIQVRPFRSPAGADEVSYARFLQEQIIRNPAHLRDPQTLAALFGDGVPTSAESEVYRAVILLRSGDLAGARVALRTSLDMVRERGRSLDIAASRTHEAVRHALDLVLPDR